jgi:hypothetical protein
MPEIDYQYQTEPHILDPYLPWSRELPESCRFKKRRNELLWIVTIAAHFLQYGFFCITYYICCISARYPDNNDWIFIGIRHAPSFNNSITLLPQKHNVCIQPIAIIPY